MSQLDNLIRKRGVIKAKLTNFVKFINKFESDITDGEKDHELLLLELQNRYDRAIKIIDEFEDVQYEIDVLGVDSETQDDERETFEGSFYSSTAKVKRLLSNKTMCSDSLFVASPTPDQSVRLPVIDLPKFKGEYETWLEFRDIFESLIHNNNAINNIQKFHYLISALSGSAREVISSLEITQINYDVAWDLLCTRYNNSRILIQIHLKSLFDIEKIALEKAHLIRKFIDDIRKHMRALAALKEPTENWDTIIIYLATTKLDSGSNREWEQHKVSLKGPELEDLLELLKNRADLLETLDHIEVKQPIASKSKTNARTKSFIVANESNVRVCAICKGEHYIQDCPNFAKLSVQGRIDQVKRLKLCINCLRTGHYLQQCRSSSCKKCKARHHTLLHLEYNRPEPPSQSSTTTQAHNIHFASNTNAYSNVLLSTIIIHAYNKHNRKYLIRALLDPGSQSSFISSETRQRLGLSERETHVNVAGINQLQSTINSSCLIQIYSRYTDFSLKLRCLVIGEITSDLPNFVVNANDLQIPTNLRLADPSFNKPDKIDMLIGADYFWELLCVGQVKLPTGPIMQNTRFGWVISGPVVSASAKLTSHCNFSKLSVTSDVNDKSFSSILCQQLERFWEIEAVQTQAPMSNVAMICAEHFNKTTYRAPDGRFTVTIPFKESIERLGESHKSAERRLLSMERKFKRLPEFGEQYKRFMHEYLELKHMRKINCKTSADLHYYLPHHGVINESSTTTRLRVVFDGSCSTTTGYSLNDLQIVGPNLQPDLFSALIRYRKYIYVMAADIRKMYRACLINPEQTKLQRILWRDSSELPIDTYELLTVTYGPASASYLATRCLKQISLECSDPVVANVIGNHFYVDDLLTGANSLDELSYIIREVQSNLEKSGFQLAKWTSNDPQLLQEFTESNSSESVDLGRNENTRTLGLLWNSTEDEFHYRIKINSDNSLTKRAILSDIAQIFDPLGLLCPVIIKAKIILQKIWQTGLDWDEPLPNSLYTSWLKFRDKLSCLNSVRIPRCISLKQSKIIEIHGFSDASTQAYGACVYLRSFESHKNISVQLVCAKSRVAPLKRVTVPRLELLGALLLSDLIIKVNVALGLDISRIVCWTDSSVVLGWLAMDHSKLQVFVGNRIARILEKTCVENWRYVVLLRGMDCAEEETTVVE
ncbi:uncharacterized protein [Onthophagus taurus]|uniref:uncharacterized protein n=1 Tax=Onthophagus taurus TaxID=166361 RepID=UPI0039BE71BD